MHDWVLVGHYTPRFVSVRTLDLLLQGHRQKRHRDFARRNLRRVDQPQAVVSVNLLAGDGPAVWLAAS